MAVYSRSFLRRNVLLTLSRPANISLKGLCKHLDCRCEIFLISGKYFSGWECSISMEVPLWRSKWAALSGSFVVNLPTWYTTWQVVIVRLTKGNRLLDGLCFCFLWSPSPIPSITYKLRQYVALVEALAIWVMMFWLVQGSPTLGQYPEPATINGHRRYRGTPGYHNKHTR